MWPFDTEVLSIMNIKIINPYVLIFIKCYKALLTPDLHM